MESEDIKNKERESLREKVLKRFLEFKNNYIDDLPIEKLLPSDQNYYLYKCRGNFFWQILIKIDLLLSKEVLTKPDQIEKCKEYKRYLESLDFSKLISKENIIEINAILDGMIEMLQQPYGS